MMMVVEDIQTILPLPHFSCVKWDAARWPNFSTSELSCSHCGQYYHWPDFLDRLQWVRNKTRRSLTINSAHRCAHYNALIGGAVFSQHKKLAVDISLRGQDRLEVAKWCAEAGFTGFGFYQNFLHIDLGRVRSWYGKGAKPLWPSEQF